MRNPWEVERPEVAGDVITVRVVQALGLLIMDARHSATPQKSGILSIQNIDIDDVSAHFKISRRKYYNIVNAGLTDDMSMDKGLSKLKDIVELAERFGLKAWQFFKAAEETDDLLDMILAVYNLAGLPPPRCCSARTPLRQAG